MKITATKENLLNGIQTVQKAISNKNTIPILSGIYLKAEKNKLFFRATDLEIGIECQVPVNVIEEGNIVLPAKHFSELVRKLPNTKITIAYREDIVGVNINYDDAEVDLKGWPGEEFPVMPDLEREYEYELDTNVIKSMIKQTLFATAADDSRPIFTGALVEVTDNNINMVTTDTHRLALRSGKIINKMDKGINLIIPGKTLSEISRIIKDEDEIIKIKGNNNQISFATGEARIISRIIEGKFPNYKQVIPQDYKTFLKVKTKALQETIERANLFSSEKDGTSIIKITVDNNSLQVTSKSEIGKVEEKMPIFMEGDNLEISFNAKYLLDALKVMDAEDLDINLTGSLSPGIIKPGNNGNYLYLILPLRNN